MSRASFCLKIKNPEYRQGRDQAQPLAVVDHTPTRFGYAQGNGSGTGVESLLRSDPSCKPLIFLLAPVAQRIRASDFGSEGWGFESLRARYSHSAEPHGFAGLFKRRKHRPGGATYGVPMALQATSLVFGRRGGSTPICSHRPLTPAP